MILTRTIERDEALFSAEVTRTAVCSVAWLRSFGPHLPKHLVESLQRQIAGSAWMMSITLVDSGEVTGQRLSLIPEDPLAP